MPPPAKSQATAKLGLKLYYNNPALSDIVIHYGKNGEKKFYGHRIVLASKSNWFQVAFTTQCFMESQEKEITLHDDNPEALEKMLAEMYSDSDSDSEFSYDTMSADHAMDAALFDLKLYEVADKYDVPYLRSGSRCHFNYMIRQWADSMQLVSEHDVHHEENFVTIVEKVYDRCHGIKPDLMDLAFGESSLSIITPRSPQCSWLKMASAVVPEFGHDILVHLLEKSEIPVGHFCIKCEAYFPEKRYAKNNKICHDCSYEEWQLR